MSTNLDDLLKELESSNTPVKSSPISSAKIDDLDSLIQEFEVGTPSNPTSTPSKPQPGKEDDDLDKLLMDLGEPMNLTPQTKPQRVGSQKRPQETVSSSKKSDDLDDLLNDLMESDTPKKAQQPPPQQNNTKPVSQVKPTPVSQGDDLDALLNDLTQSPQTKQAPNPQQQPPQSPLKQHHNDRVLAPPRPSISPKVEPKQQNNKPKDDLDSLLESLEDSSPTLSKKQTSVSKPTPVQPSKTSSPKSSKTDDELDSLISGLGSPQQRSGNRNDPLASLLNELDEVSPPQKSSPGPQRKQQDQGDDLDSLMAELSVKNSKREFTPQGSPQTGHSHSHNHSHSHHSHSNSGSNRHSPQNNFNDFLSDVSNTVTNLHPSDSSSRGTCFHCGNEIYGEAMRALGRIYHPEHFHCVGCHSTIGTRNFYDVKGQPHCEQCYQKQFCPICSHCSRAITDKCVTAMGKKWHLSCFVCTQCLQPFSGNYFEKDQRPYCEKCFHQVFSARCRACAQPIYGDCINALGSQWHPEHFNCQFCHEAFSGMFFELDGLPYCSTHYYQQMGETCAGCEQPIAGTSVEAMGKKWHPEHFVCAFCMNTLSGTSYTEKNSKPYCKACHTKLFT